MSFAVNHQFVGLRWQHMTHPNNSSVKSLQRKSRIASLRVMAFFLMDRIEHFLPVFNLRFWNCGSSLWELTCFQAWDDPVDCKGEWDGNKGDNQRYQKPKVHIGKTEKSPEFDKMQFWRKAVLSLTWPWWASILLAPNNRPYELGSPHYNIKRAQIEIETMLE